jgi:hypothetical protein
MQPAMLLFGDVCDKDPVISIPTETYAPFTAVYCCHHWSCLQLSAILQHKGKPIDHLKTDVEK